MFKIFIRIFLLIFTTIFIFVAYLSLFGIKTDKFNELINSQIANYDKRIKVDLNDVFVKLNILEKSFSLNSRNFNVFVQNQKQEIDNLDILIGFESLFLCYTLAIPFFTNTLLSTMIFTILIEFLIFSKYYNFIPSIKNKTN